MVLAIFGAQFVIGNLLAALAPERPDRAFRAAATHRWHAIVYPAVFLVVYLVGVRLLKDTPTSMLMTVFGFGVLAALAGCAQGCVNLAATFFKIDPAKNPFKAFNAGFAAQAALAFVPLVNKFVLPWLSWWGFGALLVTTLGMTAPEDGVPPPPDVRHRPI